MTLRKIPAEQPQFKLDFVQTISRDLAHKRRVENVYLTSMARISENEFACGAYVPQANGYLNQIRSGPNDVVLALIEIGRQIGIALCHAYLGVDRSDVFILDTLRFDIFSPYYSVDWVKDDLLTARMTIENRRMRAEGSLSGVCATIDFHSGDSLVCRLHSDWSIHPLESGRRLREISRVRNLRSANPTGSGAPPFDGFKIQPIFSVTRPLLHRDLWVSFNGVKFAALLQIDTENLFFFDHQNDHVPGMLIIEGMRELAIDVAMRFPHKGETQPRLLCIDTIFKQFAELDYPVMLVAEIKPEASDPTMGICVQAQQFDKTVSVGHFTLE
jgi:hypothetical protein